MSHSRILTPLAITVALGSILAGLWGIPSAFAVGDVKYTVHAGDTPASIAEQLKVPLLDFLAQLGGILVPGKDIVVCPPGAGEPDYKSQYIERYEVQKADVKPNETWANVCRVLLTTRNVKLDPEEIADFNCVPRQYHLVQVGDTLAGIAQRYDASLKPLARFLKTTPAALVRGWNRLDEVQGLAEGRLLTVGWQEPHAGDALFYPLIEKMRLDVESDLKKEGLITPGGAAQFYNSKVSYQLYAFKEGDTLEELAKQSNMTVVSLRKANNLDANETPAVGQPLFVPTAESAFAGSAAIFKTYANEGALLRSRPAPDAASNPLDKGQTLWVYERPWVSEARWCAVMVDSNKKPWAWVKESDIKYEEPRRRFYAAGRTGPEPPQDMPMQPFRPNVVAMSGIPETVSGAKRTALEIAMVFAQNRVRYQMGTQGTRSIDCSGLVWYCFTHAGVWSPGTERDAARTQANRGRPVTSNLMPADRLYWQYGRLGGAIDHTGLYLGGGMDIEATPGYVQLRSFNSRRSHVVKVMRDPPY
jgi:LysM repeat protein